MTVELKDLAVECVIGDLPRERLAPSRVMVDISLETPSAAAQSDLLEDAADYAAAARAVRDTLAAGKPRLLEKAAALAAAACIGIPNVLAASVKVRKACSIPGLGEASAAYSLKRNE